MEPPSESITCPVCAKENSLYAVFCRECGTPVSPTCNLDPYHQIFSEGHLYRKAVMGRPKLIAVLGMWALFLPGLLIYPLTLFAESARPLPQKTPAYLGLFMWIVGIIILYRVTSNYLRKRDLQSENASEDSGIA